MELALRDPAGAAIVSSERVGAGTPAVGTAASLRLARSLRALGCAAVRATGRLCLVRAFVLPPGLSPPAPLVLDTDRGGTGAGGAHRTVLVAGPGVEPALALVVAASFERGGRPPALIANRIEDVGRWEAIGALVTGESRLAAAIARAGREPRGQLGAAIRELVESWEREAW